MIKASLVLKCHLVQLPENVIFVFCTNQMANNFWFVFYKQYSKLEMLMLSLRNRTKQKALCFRLTKA